MTENGHAPPKKSPFLKWLNISLCIAAIIIVILWFGRVAEVSFDVDAAVLTVGEAYTPAVSVKPGFAMNKKLRYTSDNDKVAMVDAAGIVRAFAPGQAVISAESTDGSNKSARMWVQVFAESNDSINIIESPADMEVGESRQLSCEITPEDAQVIWNSGDPAIATVNGNGVVTALRPGKTVVRASINDEVFDELAVTVLKITPAISANATPLPSTEEQAGATAINLMFTGDLLCLQAQRAAAAGSESGFEGSFEYVSDAFKGADYVVGSLHTCAAPSFPYTVDSAGAPVLNAPAAYLSALSSVGFNALMTANDHCCDTGAKGIGETIVSLDNKGLKHTGVFGAPGGKRFLIEDVNGVKLAFLSYSESFGGRDSLLTAAERSYMVNPFSKERVTRDIASARKDGAGFIIVYMHWGNEDDPVISPAQRASAATIADAGADLIIGSGPACLQSVLPVTAKDGKQVMCAYSLGNFISSMPLSINNDTVILNATLEMDGGGVHLSRLGYIPLRVVPSYQDSSYVALPVGHSSMAANRISEAMGSELEIIEYDGGTDAWQAASYMTIE